MINYSGMRLTIIFLLFSFFGISQDISNSIGVVTLSEDFDETNTQFEILNSDGTVWLNFNVLCQGEYSSESCKKVSEQLNIIQFGIVSPLLKIRCISENDSLYEIVIHEDTPVKKFIRKDERLTLETWDEYILSSSVLGYENDTNPLKKEINGDSFTESEMASVGIFKKHVEINGDWVKLYWDGKDRANAKEGYGWIRWKEGNEIIVKVLFLT